MTRGTIDFGESPLFSILERNQDETFHSPVLLGPSTIAECASSAGTLRMVSTVLEKLEPDSYTRYLAAYLEQGMQRFGSQWKLLEIMNVLYAAAHLIRPRRYMEIGVRRGRSVAMVLAACRETEVVGFDMWIEDYAGMENPGAAFVKKELEKVAPRASVELIDGDSHKTVPEFFEANPGVLFDLITVDGDHSEKGALQDLRDTLPRLSVGGVIVFDDIAHPQHPYLMKTWRKAVREDGGLAPFEFTELGYGVAFAVRKCRRDSRPSHRGLVSRILG